jgi:hypothetical protein
MAKQETKLKTAYDMGKRAFYRGILFSPYKRASVLNKEWQRGFDTAYFSNLTTS